MTIIRYFAYGSNMLTERLQARCASAKVRHVACARGWTLSFSKRSQDGSGKAMISPCAGRQAFGVVFDLDKRELPELDQLEGLGKGYDRKDDFLVHVAGSGEPLNVVTYVASPSHIDTDLEPFDWYLSLVVVGARQHKLPPASCCGTQSFHSHRSPAWPLRIRGSPNALLYAPRAGGRSAQRCKSLAQILPWRTLF